MAGLCSIRRNRNRTGAGVFSPVVQELVTLSLSLSLSLYSGTSLMWTPMGQKNVREVSSFQRLKCMQEWYILGVGKGVLSSGVSS